VWGRGRRGRPYPCCGGAHAPGSCGGACAGGGHVRGHLRAGHPRRPGRGPGRQGVDRSIWRSLRAPLLRACCLLCSWGGSASFAAFARSDAAFQQLCRLLQSASKTLTATVSEAAAVVVAPCRCLGGGPLPLPWRWVRSWLRRSPPRARVLCVVAAPPPRTPGGGSEGASGGDHGGPVLLPPLLISKLSNAESVREDGATAAKSAATMVETTDAKPQGCPSATKGGAPVVEGTSSGSTARFSFSEPRRSHRLRAKH
jgi:hypothetical protein